MTSEEIKKLNKSYNIKTVFYYDDSLILGYAEANTIYLNLNNQGTKTLEEINRHELFHFFEETNRFKEVKGQIIASLTDSNISKLRNEYYLRYLGLYTKEEIDKGMIDTEIVIDLLSNNSKFTNQYIIDQGKEILKECHSEIENKRYLSISIKNNISNMKGLTKWEKIFAENYYDNTNYDGKVPNMPEEKVKGIRKDIRIELDNLYNLGSNVFNIDKNSKDILREYESELKALEGRGEKESADILKRNKEASLEELTKLFSNKLYEEYQHIVGLIKNSNYDDSFKALMLRETLLKTYKKDGNSIIINKRKLNETISGHMILNNTTLDTIYKNLDDYNNFANLYFASLASFNNSLSKESTVSLENVNTFNRGKWLKFAGKRTNSDEYIANSQKLATLVANTPWCTKTLASIQLEHGDFYVFADNDNKPHIAVKLTGNSIDEVRGIKNGNSQELEEEYRDVAISFLENNKNIKYGKEWLEKEEWNKRLIHYIKEIDENKFQAEETGKLLKDVFNTEDYRSHFNNNSNVEELKSKLPLIRDKIAEYYKCSEKEICMENYTPKKETICPYKIILGDANFMYSKVIDLGELQNIEGNANFANSQIAVLGELQNIGGNASFNDSQVTNLGKLKNIGGYANFKNFKITDLGNLENIGGDANFHNSQVTDLGKLQSIGGNADFCYSQITDLGGLQSIGGNAYFSSSQVADLGQLKNIGGKADFCYSQVTDLGGLQNIGGNVNFSASRVTCLSELKNIGGNANFSSSQLENLGKLKNIGGYVNFSTSQVTNLGGLQNIGGSADFANSQIANLGELQKIGGYVDFRDSQIANLGRLQSIGGNAIFNDSQIADLGELKNIGGDAYFRNSLIVSLGNLQNIRSSAHFENSRVTDLGELKNIGNCADFENCQIRSLGKLQNIGGYADFSRSQVIDLGELKNIGGEADFRHSQITDLGNLKNIEGKAHFDNPNLERQYMDLKNKESKKR